MPTDLDFVALGNLPCNFANPKDANMQSAHGLKRRRQPLVCVPIVVLAEATLSFTALARAV